MNDDREFLERFEAGTIEPFHHRDHVRMAWLYLRWHSVPVALEWIMIGIKNLATSAGRPNLYHETITWAFVLLVNERMERTGRRTTWEEFASANPDLFVWRPSVLDRYYLSETLASELARRVFVLPDRIDARS